MHVSLSPTTEDHAVQALSKSLITTYLYAMQSNTVLMVNQPQDDAIPTLRLLMTVTSSNFRRTRQRDAAARHYTLQTDSQ